MRKRADSLAFVPKDGVTRKELVFRAGDNCPNTAVSLCKQCLKTFCRNPNSSCWWLLWHGPKLKQRSSESDYWFLRYFYVVTFLYCQQLVLLLNDAWRREFFCWGTLCRATHYCEGEEAQADLRGWSHFEAKSTVHAELSPFSFRAPFPHVSGTPPCIVPPQHLVAYLYTTW